MDWIDFRPMLLLPLYQQKPTAFISLAFHKIRQQYLDNGTNNSVCWKHTDRTRQFHRHGHLTNRIVVGTTACNRIAPFPPKVPNALVGIREGGWPKVPNDLVGSGLGPSSHRHPRTSLRFEPTSWRIWRMPNVASPIRQAVLSLKSPCNCGRFPSPCGPAGGSGRSGGQTKFTASSP